MLSRLPLRLENVPEIYRDWHPGSENTVLDLVHPSLFPVVYGRTKILRDNVVNLDDCVEKCGEGVTLEVPPSEEAALVTLYNPMMTADHFTVGIGAPWMTRIAANSSGFRAKLALKAIKSSTYLQFSPSNSDSK